MNEFFAYLSRLKLIRRWSLMRSSVPENDAEHSLQVAMIAHCIALIGKKQYQRDINPEHVLTLAAYHDATEVLTGDLPTPVKYHSSTLRGAYAQVENMAIQRLLAMLPESLQPDYEPILKEENTLARQIVKAADKISAYLKCVEEQRAGNHEFDAAADAILAVIHDIDLPEVQDFMDHFAPAFSLTLDELNRQETQP